MTMSDPAFSEYEEKYEALRRLEADILPRNKTVLFDALAAHGIATVMIEFEGSGDSGQMEDPCARTSDDAVVELPSRTLEMEHVDWSLGLGTESKTVSGAVKLMAWRILGDAHEGWENADGGYGQFTFNVADRTITLEYNERYVETNFYTHEF